MAKLRTTPMVRCKRCLRRMVVSDLISFDDPSGEKLRSMLKALEKSYLCPDCIAHRDYLIREGRGNEFYSGY